jgi:hypothetical protein
MFGVLGSVGWLGKGGGQRGFCGRMVFMRVSKIVLFGKIVWGSFKWLFVVRMWNLSIV